VWFLYSLLFGALILAVGLSPHARGHEQNESFWLFNHRLGLGALLALVRAGLFGGGLSIILETLNFLFGLHFPFKWHEHIWTAALGFMAPVKQLTLAPQNFTDKISERATEFTTRAVAPLWSSSCWCRYSSSTQPFSMPTPRRSDLSAHCPKAHSAT